MQELSSVLALCDFSWRDVDEHLFTTDRIPTINQV